jgi:DNA-binding transcriptional MerR regulator
VDEGWSGAKTAEIVGITYRQLDYWARTDLVRPSVADANGSGSRRRYSYANLLELKIIKRLLDAGIRLEQVREVFSYLRQQVGTEVASANIVIDGHLVMLARDDGELIDLVRKGQGVLNILSLANVRDEVDTSIKEFPASRDNGSHVAVR